MTAVGYGEVIVRLEFLFAIIRLALDDFSILICMLIAE